MSGGTSAFTTPNKSKPSSKRKYRSNGSPEDPETPKRVQRVLESATASPVMSRKIPDMPSDEFFSKLDAKLAKLATKEDFSELKELVESLRKENQSLKQEIARLKNRDEETRRQIDDIVNRSKRNNIIFRGVRTENNNCASVVKKFCVNVLGCSDSLVVNRAHTLPIPSKDNIPPLIAHIPRDEDITNIFKNVNRLKGTGYVVHRDYTKEVRRKRYCLNKIKRAVEECSEGVRTRLVYNHLYVNNTRYDWDAERGLSAGKEDGALVLGAALNHNFTPLIKSLLQQSNNVPARMGAKNEVSML